MADRSQPINPQGNVVLVKEVQLNAEIEFTKKVEKRNDELKSKEEKNLESKVATKEGVVPFKDLFRFMDVTDKILMGISFVFAMSTGAIIPLTSWALGGILNGASDPVKFQQNVNIAVLYQTILAVAAFIVQGGGTALSIISSERQVHRLRKEYFKALLRQDISFMDQIGVNQAATRLTEETLQIQSGIGEKLFLLLTGFAQFTGSLTLGFAVAAQSWRLALTVLALVPMVVAVFGIIFSVVQKLSGKSDSAYAKAGELLNESLSMIKTVAAFGGEEAEVTKYDSQLVIAEKEGLKNGAVNGASTGVFICALCIFYGVGLYAGARFIGLNRAEYPECILDPSFSYNCFGGGQVIQTIFSIIGGAAAMGIVGPNISYIATAKSAAYKIFQIIDRKPEIDPYATDGLKPNEFKGKIEFVNVFFAYPIRPQEMILSGFNLVIEPGTSCALVGSSGSGKSTIIALLQRWYAPLSGSILIDDIPIEKYNLAWLRSQLSLVSQEPQLLPLSIRDNIAAGLSGEVKDDDIIAAAKAASAHDFIMTLPGNYSTKVSSNQLSGGQKQRVCIARAIIRKTKVLLLDEATSALDSKSEKIIQADLDKILESGGRTAIMIAHRLSTVTGVDKIVAMEKGKVLESGSHKELVAKGKELSLYCRLWETQALYGNETQAIQKGIEAQVVQNVTESNPSVSNEVSNVTTSSLTTVGENNVDIKVVLKKENMHGKVAEVEEISDEAKEDLTKNGSWRSLPNVSFKKAWAYQAPEALWILLGGIMATIGGGVTPAFAVLLTKFITIFYNPDTDAMISQSLNYLIWFIVIGAATFMVNLTQGFSWGSAGERFIRRLRRGAYASLISQAPSFYDMEENSVGRVGARVGINAAKMKIAIGAKLGEKISAVSTLFIGIGIALNASWQLTLVVLALGPLLIYASRKENDINFSLGEDVKEGLSEASNVVTDATNAIRVVHSFALQESLQNKFNSAIEAPFKTSKSRGLRSGAGFGLSQLIQPLNMAIIFFVGIQFSKLPNSNVTFESIVQVFFAFQFSSFSLINIVTLFADVATIKGSLRSLFYLIDKKSEIDGTEEAARLANIKVAVEKPLSEENEIEMQSLIAPIASKDLIAQNGNIEFRNVYFSYPARPDAPVLKGLSLTIELGQTVGIVGPSGSGKSSIIQLLLRFYDPNSGVIFLNDRDIKSIPARSLRNNMGWVQQEAPLFADSIAYNIAYGRAGGEKSKPAPFIGMPRDADMNTEVPSSFVADDDVVSAATDSNMYEYLIKFKHGLATFVGERGSGISGGQKQRVALARALIRKPNILILDEATSALDSESEKIVQASIDKLLVKAEGKDKRTTIMIAHRLATIAKCDVIFVIDEGRVAEKGNFNELCMAGGLFRKLADAQGLTMIKTV